MNQKKIEDIIISLLTEIGEDTSREGLQKTPQRVARAYTKLFEGYNRSLKSELTVFKNTNGYDDIIYSGRINFSSVCEHHMLPFFGLAHIAYVPGDDIIGLSKMARAVDIFSRRLQDQERITVQIANELDLLLKPKGVAVMLEGQHLCNMARGVEQYNSNMKTLAFRGIFKQSQEFQNRFFHMVN